MRDEGNVMNYGILNLLLGLACALSLLTAARLRSARRNYYQVTLRMLPPERRPPLLRKTGDAGEAPATNAARHSAHPLWTVRECSLELQTAEGAGLASSAAAAILAQEDEQFHRSIAEARRQWLAAQRSILQRADSANQLLRYPVVPPELPLMHPNE
jgi:hypothetical protein